MMTSFVIEDESMDKQSDKEEDMISIDTEVIFDRLRNLYACLHQPVYGFCTYEKAMIMLLRLLL